MALIHLREYHRPTDLGTALALLRRQDIRVVPLAGGTHLTAEPDSTVEAVVDLGRLALAEIRFEDGEIRLGAMLPLESLTRSGSLGRIGPVLSGAVRRLPSWQMRQAATLGGTLMTGALPELEAVLLSLDARVLLIENSSRIVDLDIFLEERTRLAVGALLIDVIIPRLTQGVGFGTARVSCTPNSAPIVSAIAYVVRQGNQCLALRLAAAGVSPRPVRLREAEARLIGQAWTPDNLENAAQHATASVSPPPDLRGSSMYRRAMVGICTRRALTEAWEAVCI